MDYNSMAMGQMAAGGMGMSSGSGSYGGGINPYAYVGQGGVAQYQPYQGRTISGNPNQGATNTYVTNRASTNNYTAPAIQMPSYGQQGALNYNPTFNMNTPAPPQPQKPKPPEGSAPSGGQQGITWNNPDGSVINNTSTPTFLSTGMQMNPIAQPYGGFGNYRGPQFDRLMMF